MIETERLPIDTGASVRVLLIEGDADDAAAIHAALVSQNAGSPFELYQVARLDAGLPLLRSFRPDIVLLDLQLPDAAAAQSLTEIRRIAPATPIIVLTEASDAAGASAALQKGATDYLVKAPLDATLLLRTIRYSLESHRIKKELDFITLELRASHSRLELMALSDPLTGLLNRRGLQQALSREIESMRRNGTDLVVVIVNVDDFAEINEALGHGVGDVVLQEIANRLKARLRPTDSIARIGGDEFMILLPKARPAEGIRIAERMRLSVSGTRITLSERSVQVTASLGVVVVTEHTPSIDELLSQSRPIVYYSKKAGKNRVSSAGDSPSSVNGDDPAAEILEALREGRLLRTVKHALLSLEDEKEVGFELLSRLSMGVLNLPDDFFRLALESNILTLTDHHCLRNGIDASSFLQDHLRIHLNLFPSTLIDIPVEHLIEMFPTVRPEGRFCIEISEQQILGDPSYLLDPVARLREAGIRIAIDDVGFGSSCLESLILLEPEVIKIDKRCLDGISHKIANVRSLKRLLKVAESLGAEVVAEGIDSRENLAVLRDLGVKYGQGFLWGMPA